MLALGEIEQWNHRSALVTFWIDVEDGFDSLKRYKTAMKTLTMTKYPTAAHIFVLLGELEGNIWIILGRVTVNEQMIAHTRRRLADGANISQLQKHRKVVMIVQVENYEK